MWYYIETQYSEHFHITYFLTFSKRMRYIEVLLEFSLFWHTISPTMCLSVEHVLQLCQKGIFWAEIWRKFSSNFIFEKYILVVFGIPFHQQFAYISDSNWVWKFPMKIFIWVQGLGPWHGREFRVRTVQNCNEFYYIQGSHGV